MKKEVIEGNKLIAEFMNSKVRKWVNEFNEDCVAFDLYNSLFPVDKLHYHDDWNWLMLAVNKISNTLKQKETPYDYWIVTKFDRPITTPIADVYKSVIQFITWYNSLNTK